MVVHMQAGSGLPSHPEKSDEEYHKEIANGEHTLEEVKENHLESVERSTDGMGGLGSVIADNFEDKMDTLDEEDFEDIKEAIKEEYDL